MAVLCSISVIGLDGHSGTSVGHYVEAAVGAIKDGVKRYHVGPMETSFEVESVAEALDLVRRVHHTVEGRGAERIIITFKMDHRLDKEVDMDYKVRRAKGQV